MARELFEIGLSLFLGAIWFTACVPKLRHSRSFAVTVLSYDLLPVPLAVALSHVLPFLELALAVVLICGFALPVTGIASALAFAVFLTAMIINLARGRRIECGCGTLGGRRTIGAFTIARTVALLGCSVALPIVAPPAWTAFWFPAPGGWSASLWDAAFCLTASITLWALLTRPAARQSSPARDSHSIAPTLEETGGNR